MINQEEICPICGEGHLEHRVEKNPVEYKGRSTLLDSHYSVCDTCGSEQANANQTRKNKRLMLAFKKTVDGLLTGAEIKALRLLFGINQTQAAEIFGGGPVAFSKYENDDVMQSEAMDKLLRVASEFPDAFCYLSKKAGIEIASSSQKSVHIDQTEYAHIDEVKRPQLRLVHSSKWPTKSVSAAWTDGTPTKHASC